MHNTFHFVATIGILFTNLLVYGPPRNSAETLRAARATLTPEYDARSATQCLRSPPSDDFEFALASFRDHVSAIESEAIIGFFGARGGIHP
jgi:hypothetical protein